jgi:hypothetical protein
MFAENAGRTLSTLSNYFLTIPIPHHTLEPRRKRKFRGSGALSAQLSSKVLEPIRLGLARCVAADPPMMLDSSYDRR